MAHLKAVNSLLLYCRDIQASAAFYQALGFSIGPEHDGVIMATLGSFTVQLLDQAKATFQQDAPREKGAGVFIEIEVENIDDLHDALVSKGLRPSGAPHDWPWGNREFAMKDPDGYRVVMYERLK